MHRGYHGLAIPTFERKARVFANWLVHLFWGRDFTSVRKAQTPRDFFEEFASRPVPITATRQKVAAR
jgi:NADH dehydrogenase